MMATGFDQEMARLMCEAVITPVVAFRLDLPSGVTRLHSGLGELVLDGEVFYGVGSLGDVSQAKEQLTTSPTQVSVSLTGLDQALLAAVMSERVVGCMGRLYLCLLSETGEPLRHAILFKGRVASAPIQAGEVNAIRLTLSNIFEDWKHGLPRRYTDESHRRRYPQDRFFRYQDEMANRSINWGSKKDAPGFVYKE